MRFSNCFRILRLLVGYRRASIGCRRGSETPMKRPGQPVEMAPLYVLLASQESSYVTGEVYGATGGLEVS